MLPLHYDIIVVGAGHAGSEAAAATAHLGANTLLITHDMTKIAQMSCNPAMGGIAKGQILREIDALGGVSAIITDLTTVQYRMLNRSKGPAMWSPRAQCDRALFSLEWRKYLENTDNLSFWQDDVIELLLEKDKVIGVKTAMGVEFKAEAVILTNGTFLNGLIHIGSFQVKGGRISEPASQGLTAQLEQLGFAVGRMKTGTPARLDGRTIDFTKLIEQPGDEIQDKFSYLPHIKTPLPQRSCYITYTNKKTHTILERGFEFAPLFNGTIQSIGPRYCPSIETKLVTFKDKDSHHLFIEPEGINTHEYYINGFSSSLPWDIQYKALHQIPGLENVKLFRPGYAIEYDYFDPTQLLPSLETKKIKHLFFAGQINGTTGYEEAAAQGLIAGINAVQKIKQHEPLILKRDEAYIGVLIDDLVTKGVDEPYRMFTSRAEYRILLRQDNADQRLTPIGYELGLASKERMNLLENKLAYTKQLTEFIKDYSVEPKLVKNLLEENDSTPLKQKVKLRDVLSRPQIKINALYPTIPTMNKLVSEIPEEIRFHVLEQAEIEIKYAGYIEREQLMANKIRKFEDLKIPEQFDYHKLNSLSTEAREKLSKIKPSSIGQASRIPGVSPSDIHILLVYLGR
ncbi:MAG: tRNA uridine-5-carboxymethylaminomethyl(34) synthesis enzyme MnmG [Bacteroidales bacterium]